MTWHHLSCQHKRALKEHLRSMLTMDRATRIETVCQLRTEFLQLAIEDLVAANNAGNVMRSCDCLGVQQVHLFGHYDINRVAGIAKGSYKWLNVHQYSSSIATVEHVRALRQNMQLVVTTPHNPTVTLDEFVPTGPTLLFFGSEVDGVSQQLLAEADERLAVPLYGFCESLNVSTCAGIVLYTLMHKIKAHNLAWQLTEEQALDTSIDMMRHSLGQIGNRVIEQWLMRND